MPIKRLSLTLCFAILIPMGAVATAENGRFECFEKRATIVGTFGDDVLSADGNKAEVIMGMGGDDVIFGSNAGDRLCGGTGNDYIRGGNGRDRIQGAAGRDDVDGNFGYDRITQGGPGNDRVSDCDSEYTGGVNIIKGGPGND